MIGETMAGARFGSVPVFYVEHKCTHGRCDQITRVVLRDVNYPSLDGELRSVLIPMSFDDLRLDLPGEVGDRGIGMSGDRATLMGWSGLRVGAHRMAACANCYELWSIDEEIGDAPQAHWPFRRRSS